MGTLGAGPNRFLQNETPLRYTVFFENLLTAGAPAQEVVITDQLDPNKVDLTTFQLGSITFGDITVPLPPALSSYDGGIDLHPTQNLIVRTQAQLDKSTGLVTWRFTSIDPATGQLTEDPLAGFLPPNTNPPAGEGQVLFTVMPKPGLTTGTTITNQARIIFDLNASIDTPVWLNTLDVTKPRSQVLPLAVRQSSASFTVNWSGTDEGAGITGYTIFVAENGGLFTPWLVNTPFSTAVFTGQVERSYSFYSIARDGAGNEEDAPSVADTTTSVGSSEDLCPNDPEKTAPGACGCGVPDSEAGKTCTTGQPGICSAGITVCANGTRSCQQNLQPRVEVCDGLDNNCSGAVDEGNPGGGAACSTGLLRVCSAGTQPCTNGVLGCRQTTQPSAELCTDSLDNNCDGTVNEGCASACATNVTAHVTVSRGGFRRHHATGRFVQQLTLKNTGPSAIAGPVAVAIDNLSATTTLFNKTGITSCATPASPYVIVNIGADNMLSQGERATVVLEFNHPTNGHILMNTRVLAGAPQ